MRSGELGFVHTLRAATNDRRPPEPGYVPTSGGIFRDCSIHDCDVVRFGDRRIAHARLTVPHPELERRDFWQRGIAALAAADAERRA